ncbi:hypothetical protein L9F63_022084, partial [Diploptera punctata]
AFKRLLFILFGGHMSNFLDFVMWKGLDPEKRATSDVVKNEIKNIDIEEEITHHL